MSAGVRIGLASAAMCLGLAWTAASQQGSPPSPVPRNAIQSFTLTEAFGVSHPKQIVDFDLGRRVDASACRLVDAASNEVPYQLLEDGRKLAVQADLPAGVTKTWWLVKGRPTATGGVAVAQTASGFEITNEFTGVRVPAPAAALSNLPAPVQGVRMRDGFWASAGPNPLHVEADRVTAMDVRFVERGPQKVVVEVSYRFDRPEYAYGNQKVAPAGPGFYTSTITVEAGQPSILFEEDTDMNLSYSINLYDAVHPTSARYRGHHSRGKEYGYEPDGQAYRMWHARPGLDAQVDLRYDRPMPSSYVSNPDSWRRMAVWDPWAFDTGWYWVMFDTNAPPAANVVGIFAGRASRALGAHCSGTGLYTLPAGEGAKPQAGFTVSSARRGADGRVAPRSRYQWGLFVGTRGEDMAPPDKVQPINRQMNLYAGIGLAKVHRYALDFTDPPRGYGSLYMDKAAVQRLIDRLRADKGGVYGGGFHGYLYNAEPASRPLIDMWADASGEKTHQAAKSILDLARDLLNSHVNGEGIYAMSYHYWHGGLAMMRQGVWIDQVLATDALTPEERAKVKAAAALFAHVLWDDDVVPLFEGHALNLGTANMPVQQQGYRDFYALLLAGHPAMRERAKGVGQRTLATVRDIVNEHGAEMGCTHYIGASFAPTLNTLLQLKQLGDDPFKTEPRLARFAEFFLNFLTPPEPRAGGKRCFIALGDSGVEPSELYGVLGTGFRDADPKLSARLMGAWQAGGKPQSGFFGTTLLTIDDALPAADPRLGDAAFPGYYAVLRHGWGTTNETAVWHMNGDFYSDHRHTDHGSVVIYALGEPLAVDWSAIYTPQAPGGYYHSGVVTEESLGRAWDQDSPPLNAGGGWSASSQEAFVSAPDGAYVRSRFVSGKTTWVRSIAEIRVDEAHPVIVIRDTFEGEKAGAAKVMTLNLMATGEVETAAGRLAPPPRTHAVAEHKDGAAGHELASAAAPFALAGGVSRFGFQGRYGVDCDVYVAGDGPQQALLGDWADQAWGGHVTDREERQHILRVRGTGAFTTVIVPWRRGAKPVAVTVAPEGDGIGVKVGTATALVRADGSVSVGGRTLWHNPGAAKE